MKKIALYTRVSTDEQDTGMQLYTLKDYVEKRGFEIVEIYEDKGISGSKENRPALNKLMQDARRRKFDGVLVFRFDRFARSTEHLLKALEEFRALGIDFISYSEAIDTTTPIGKMAFTMVGAIAEFEKELIRERVKAGMRKAIAEGKKLGRPALELDIEQIKELHNTGASIRQIAKELNVSKTKVWEVLASDSVQNVSINCDRG